MKTFFILVLISFGAPLSAEEIISHDEEEISHDEEIIDQGEEGIPQEEEVISHDEELIDHGDSSSGDESEEDFLVEADLLGKASTMAQFDTQFDRANEDIVEWTQRLELQMDMRTSEEWRFLLSGEMVHWTGGKENTELVNLYINPKEVRTQFDMRLGESYAQFQRGKWNIKAGNLISRWGSTDISRPSDILNPIDRTRAIAGDASLRFAQPAVDVKYVFDDFTAQVVVIPFFLPDRAPTFGRDTSLLAADVPALSNFPVSTLLQSVVDDSNQEFVQSALVATRRPDEDPSNLSFGTRLTTTLWNTDLSLGYFFGWDRTSSLYLDPELRALGESILGDGEFLADLDLPKFLARNDDAVESFNSLQEKLSNQETLVATEFSRLHMLSVDGARYFGNFGVRFELAVHPEKTFVSETLDTFRRPFLNSALGFSYERIESEDDAFTILIEGFFSDMASYDASPTKYFVAEEERGSTQSRSLFGETNYGVIANMTWEVPWLDLQSQLAGRMDLSRKDLLIAASLQYRWTPRFKSSLGATFFESYGDEFSVGKAYEHNDFLWLKSEALF